MKLTMYPKTRRYDDTAEIRITEKLDGSNITFFKKDGVLHIAQRNRVFKWADIDKSMAYKGLIGWLDEYGKELEDSLQDNACVVGEWLGMGNIKYDSDIRFHMFAKANVYEEEMVNIYYDEKLFIYPFVDQEIPEFIDVVPTVAIIKILPRIEELDELYDWYSETVKRDVEGFIIINDGAITKYVRLKRGQLENHYIHGQGKN